MELRNSIRQILAISLMCAMLLAVSCGKSEGKEAVSSETAPVSSEEVSSAEEQGYRLVPDDFTIEGLKIGMTADEVMGVLGKPDRRYDCEATLTHGAFTSLSYDGFSLWFDSENADEPFKLNHIYITGEQIQLVNGVHVGSTLDEVFSAFDHPAGEQFDYNVDEGDFGWKWLYKDCDIEPDGFKSDWPDEVIQAAYYCNYKDYANPIHYMYFEPPVWNEEKTELTVFRYDMSFTIVPGEKTVNEIVISAMPEIYTEY